jgi:hypothetical protein
MASMILSFVGNQDPHSKHNNEGSIVSLIKHLCQHQVDIQSVWLLHTDSMQQNAIDTKDWLVSEIESLTANAIALIPVSVALSDDPINQWLAVQEARKAVEQARSHQSAEDTLDFNASSGTPAMKSAWGILQATGYAPRSHICQVRNPKEMQSGQARVFRNDVNVLKDELDIQVIKQQIQDYNYSGAIASLSQSNLSTNAIAALLQSGYYRISRNFNRAYSSLDGVANSVDPQWLQELAALRQKQEKIQLQEAYFNALTRLKTQKYADFLVDVFRLQEALLYYLAEQCSGVKLSGKPTQTTQGWQAIKQLEQGQVYRYLQNYKLPKGDLLRLNQAISRYVVIALLEYYPQYSSTLSLIRGLNEYCELRNEAVHGFVGVSEIEDQDQLLMILRKLMKQVVSIPDINPFDRLNQQICDPLDRTMQTTP